MISGATGSIATAMTAFVEVNGLELLFWSVFFMGVLQILFGVFKLGKLIRLIPHTAELGFVNGLAIVIGLAQSHAFYYPKKEGDKELVPLNGYDLGVMLAYIFTVMIIMLVMPR